MAKAELVSCVRLPKPEKATPFADSFVPANRLAAADLWSAYGVEKADTFIVTDKFGNEYLRTESCELAEHTKKVSSHIRAQRKQLKKFTNEAQAALDKGDRDAAMTALRAGFALKLVGYEESEAAAKLATTVLDAGRKEFEAAGTDAKKLEVLSKRYAGTSLAADIDAALAKARTQN